MSHVTLHPCWIVVRPLSLIIFHIVRAMNTVLSALCADRSYCWALRENILCQLNNVNCDIIQSSRYGLSKRDGESEVNYVNWTEIRHSTEHRAPNTRRYLHRIIHDTIRHWAQSDKFRCRRREKGISPEFNREAGRRRGELRKTKKFPRIMLREIRFFLCWHWLLPHFHFLSPYWDLNIQVYKVTLFYDLTRTWYEWMLRSTIFFFIICQCVNDTVNLFFVVVVICWMLTAPAEWWKKSFNGWKRLQGSFESIHISLIHVLSVVRLCAVSRGSFAISLNCFFFSISRVINLMTRKIKKRAGKLCMKLWKFLWLSEGRLMRIVEKVLQFVNRDVVFG